MKPPIFSCLNSRVLNNGSLYGRFLFGPLPIDISLTIATILRRSLLHTPAHLYISSAQIEGANHEYASLPGIQESVLEILLNLGEIVLARKKQNLVSWAKDFPSSISFFGNKVQPHQSTLTALLHISGPCVVKAKDIKWPEGVWCVKPNLPIATLSNNQTLAMKLKIMPISKQNSFNFVRGAENSDNSNISPNKLGLFRTETVSTELKPKVSTWPILQNTVRGSLRTSGNLDLETTGLPLWGQVGPKVLKKSATLSELNDCGTSQGSDFVGQIKLSPQNQKTNSYINNKFWPSKSLWGPFKASSLSIKSKSIDLSSTSIKKAGTLFTTKAIKNVPLLEDQKQQSLTLRRSLLKWNKEGFLLKQSKEIETIINTKEYVSSTQTVLPRQFNFSQTNLTKPNAIPIAESDSPSFESKDFVNKTLERGLRIKSPTHNESNNKVKGIELVVSPSTYPVEKVNFLIERDDQLAGYRHRIIFEVWTNGSISPRQAIFDSIGWILKLLYNFRQPAI